MTFLIREDVNSMGAVWSIDYYSLNIGYVITFPMENFGILVYSDPSLSAFGSILEISKLHRG
jgi:hypothetical protein